MDQWYNLISEGPLQQGEFVGGLNVYVQDSPVINPGPSGETVLEVAAIANSPDAAEEPADGQPPQEGEAGIEADLEQIRLAVIISQSCDLDSSHEYAILCPVYTVDFLIEEWESEAKVRDAWNAARAGTHFDLFPLPRCVEHGWERREALVDFKRVFEVKISRLEEICADVPARLRLMRPYRELMAQHFGRKVMRIALEDEDRVPKWQDVAPALPEATTTTQAAR